VFGAIHLSFALVFPSGSSYKSGNLCLTDLLIGSGRIRVGSGLTYYWYLQAANATISFRNLSAGTSYRQSTNTGNIASRISVLLKQALCVTRWLSMPPIHLGGL